MKTFLTILSKISLKMLTKKERFYARVWLKCVSSGAYQKFKKESSLCVF